MFLASVIKSVTLISQVTHPTKREVYLHDSIDGCWHEIQNQINEAIIARRSNNSNLQLPPLLPPPSGLEIFGFTSTSIVGVKIEVSVTCLRINDVIKY